ncbi:hypothetical protein [Novosphingobium sp. FKTRR1]|uniref:hypothetical protein n=1 Tax=Novosphingobium sp. FKTRR1 TaxID=2879118 RepID=UPI001CEFF71F|nr:hypothetical protein [Novosphingobium sp. FKTRR1]
MVDADHYTMPAHGWTCFHCGETFKTPGGARDHFGFDPASDPACQIKLGAERSLLRALRSLEHEHQLLVVQLHNEGSDALRAWAAAMARHSQQIRLAEEHGYERGLADGRKKTGQ